MHLLLTTLQENEFFKALILTNNRFNDKCVDELCQQLEKMTVQTIDMSGNLLTSVSLSFFLELAK